MTAIILGWDPEDWGRWNYPAAVAQMAATGLVLERWKVGAQRNVAAGTDAWLVLQGNHAGGLIGHGVVVAEHSEPVRASSRERGVLIAFDALVPLGEQVPFDVLHGAAPGIPWDAIPGSGLQVEAADEAAIRSIWREAGPLPGPDPTQPVAGTYPQDAVVRVLANRYERDEDARRACLARHGTSCAACGFSFELTYGETGMDFIQVHHIVPAVQLDGGYQLDPITDLVPLCPNCHAMAHLGVGPSRTVAELRRIIGGAGYLRGSSVSSEELEAQREARRILGN